MRKIPKRIELRGKLGKVDSTLDDVSVAESGLCSASRFSHATLEDCQPWQMMMDDTF